MIFPYFIYVLIIFKWAFVVYYLQLNQIDILSDQLFWKLLSDDILSDWYLANSYQIDILSDQKCWNINEMVVFSLVPLAPTSHSYPKHLEWADYVIQVWGGGINGGKGISVSWKIGVCSGSFNLL